MLSSKSVAVFLSVFLLFTICTSNTVSQTAYSASKETNTITIASLIQGLNTDKNGLQSSCAFWLGEYQCTKAVIPLQKLLRNDDCEGVRISAALALFKINTPLAINSVKQAIRFDESEREKMMAEIFYSAHLLETKQNKYNIGKTEWLAKKN